VPDSEPDVCQVLAVLYRGGEAAKEEPRLLGTIENKVHALGYSAILSDPISQLGIAGWLKENGHQLVVTDDKDGPQR
jgi:hypothetical protein